MTMPAPAIAAEFWKPWERTATSFSEVVDFIDRVHAEWVVGEERRFAWRGQVEASWALHSSLYRRLSITGSRSSAPDEDELRTKEREILADVTRWGLHWADGARLPVLPQLALLQHYGAPTRLIDITFNAWIGVWFAVEEKWLNGAPAHESADGRLFAIDVTKRIINDQPSRRAWPDAVDLPWPDPAGQQREASLEWSSRVYAWKAPPFDRRIAAQNGGFLLGGVPTSQQAEGRRQFWPKNKTNRAHWPLDTVRQMTSVAVRAHDLHRVAGKKPDAPLFTLKIASAAKAEIRNKLRDLYGYEHSTIYPDYSGFASFGTPALKSWA